MRNWHILLFISTHFNQQTVLLHIILLLFFTFYPADEAYSAFYDRDSLHKFETLKSPISELLSAQIL